jgi:hypothetical protein
MSFAFETPAESPKGPRPIQDYAVGDPVMAASAENGAWAWAARDVAFSSGTGPGGHQGAMIFIRFGEERELIVDQDQPMLIAGGKLQTASRLVPGRDSLVAADGSALAVTSVSVGRYDGGVHAIATMVGGGLDWDGSLDGHLLNCAGAICGDYVLQIRHGDPRMARYLADPHAPVIGSAEYAAQHQAVDEAHGGRGEKW